MTPLRLLAADRRLPASPRAARPPPSRARAAGARSSMRRPAPCGARPRATCASSRASPMRSRRSARCAGSRRSRCRAGQGVREATEFGAGLLPAARRSSSNIYSPASPMPMSEDCLTLNIWAPAECAQRAGVLLDPRRRAVQRVEPRADVRRRSARRARRGRRVDQLSARRARLARASRAQRGIAAAASRAITACSTRSRRCAGCKRQYRARSAAIRPTSPSPANPPAALSVMYLMASPPARGLFAQGDRARAPT